MHGELENAHLEEFRAVSISGSVVQGPSQRAGFVEAREHDLAVRADGPQRIPTEVVHPTQASATVPDRALAAG